MRMSRELDAHCELMAACAVLGVEFDVWYDHFGMLLPGVVRCCDCDDFYRAMCEGGGDPVVCMRDDAAAHMVRVHGWRHGRRMRA